MQTHRSQQHKNTAGRYSKITGHAPRQKTHLAETHSQKTRTHENKIQELILVTEQKIKTYLGLKNSFIQFNH